MLARSRISFEGNLSYLIGALVSLGLFSLILFVLGYNPVLSLETIAIGSFGSVYNATETLVLMAPFLLCALAFLIPFKSRFYNIGAEGQLYLGALFAYIASSNLANFPSVIAIPLAAIFAAFGGIVWLALPLFMRVKLGINEIFPTIVMNFIASFLLSWLVTGPIKDPHAPNPQTALVPHSTWLPVLISNTRFDIGIVFAVLCSVGIYVVLYKTVLGYEIRASGANPRAAQTGGISISKSIIWVGLLSGGLAGIAGWIAIDGQNHILVQGFDSYSWGYQGIAIAALGAFNPLGSLIASIFYSALSFGGESLQRLTGSASVPIELISTLQVTIVITLLVVQRWVSGKKFSFWKREKVS
ncbi:MAG: ABC transporter permease [Thaumarchaeota archaeon]|nr:ABC transporter permease [Nitrososphaerota archaeon]